MVSRYGLLSEDRILLLFLLEPLQETVAFILGTCTRVNEINATLGVCSLWNDL